MPRTPPRPPRRPSSGEGVSLRASKSSMRPAGRATLPSNEEIFGASGGGVFDQVLLAGTNQAVAGAAAGSDPGVLVKVPTRTSNPDRPRTRSAYYNPEDQVVTIRFRDDDRRTGAAVYYAYYDVPSNVWRNIQRTMSTGRMINRVLNNYRYARVSGVQ